MSTHRYDKGTHVRVRAVPLPYQDLRNLPLNPKAHNRKPKMLEPFHPPSIPDSRSLTLLSLG